MADAHANFASSLVATAPSPATSGTSLVVTSGQGALFPAAPFNATICPASTAPTTANAEIVRVTAVSTDTLTITRAQESTSARTVVVGDQIFAGITAQTLTDVEVPQLDPYRPTGVLYESFQRASCSTTVSLTSGALTKCAIWLPAGLTIGHLGAINGTAGTSLTHSWFGLYDSAGVQLAVTADRGTTLFTVNSLISLAIATTAAGSASTFTTTYSGIHYVGIMCAGTTPPSFAIRPTMLAGALAASPILAATSADTSQTTPPAFPHTLGAGTASGSWPYVNVAA